MFANIALPPISIVNLYTATQKASANKGEPMYFTNCKTLEEAKELYRQLARANHPDIGGDLETMQAINAEYADYCAHFANMEARTRQSQAHAENRKSAADYHDIDQVTEELRQKILAVLNLGLDVELCGLWLWVTGDTRPHREALGKNGLGFKYAGEKKAWYFAGVPTFNRKRRTLDEIRAMHGSQTFRADKTEPAGALTA
jgi:hypothetical protein